MKHFTIQQRYILEDKVKEGISLRCIAKHLDKNPSTISREFPGFFLLVLCKG
ncbi:helix-turn-helix domain-containing protein [Halosquirtibacter laminarini]|uniref:Helix-turn-helix domain-containing protein n=2 Tax=Halosquirtibacter laminarini TaxID=3374600 RepID=A0AC61NLQ8_9BACT|nr:helix-turn-helix domain-containing protein [Prolixibacteraceae bacterium]QZE15019.1 helix-turn-helix domain-containing protein [Prolixibacteraceae bacterium]